MSDRQFSDKDVHCFARLYETISNDESISRNRRRATCSALKSFARWAGLPMDQVLAHPAFLRRLFKRLTPATVDVSPKRFANVRSEIMFAMRRVDVVDNYTYLARFTADWEEYWGELPNKYVKRSLSRLVRFASAQGVRPEDFDQLASERFHTALVTDSLVSEPHTVYRNALRAWNRFAATYTARCLRQIEIPWRRDQYRLPEETFPSSFVRDVDACLERQRSSDPFDRNAPPRALRETTLKGYRSDLFCVASALHHAGHAQEKIVDLAYLVAPDHVELALTYILDRRVGKDPRKRASQLARLCAKTARYWLKAPNEHVDTLNGFAARLSPRRDGLSNKSKNGLIPFRDELNLVKLILLPDRLAKAVETGEFVDRKACLRMQQAVALSILINCPLRIGNLSALRLDRHLHWSGPGMSGKLTIMLDENEVKNVQQLTFPIPSECAHLIRVYVQKHRDGLLLPASPFLFPGRNSDRPKRARCMSKQITKLTHDTIGFRCNPHLFRHLVHLIVLRKFPAAFGMVSRVLGHKRLETTLVNYSHEATAIAMEVYQELVADTAHPLWKGRDENLEALANAANDGLL